MQNFSHKNIQEIDINSINGVGKIHFLNELVKWKLDEVIKYKTLIWDLFEFRDNCFVIKTPYNPEENTSWSRILSNHFKWIPIAPWVILKLLLLTLIKEEDLNKNNWYIKTTFLNAWVPWSKIFLWEDGRSLVDEKWEKYITIDFGSGLDDKKDDFRKLNKIKTGKTTKFQQTELDKYLLQSWEFRFADSANFITQKILGEVNIGDTLFWEYQIKPNDTCFTDARYWKEIYHWFFEEIVAQIGSLAMWKVLWEINWKKSKMLTFKESIFKMNSNKLRNNLKSDLKLNVVGVVVNKSDREISIAFIWRNQYWEKLFKWQITGDMVLVKMLERMNRGK